MPVGIGLTDRGAGGGRCDSRREHDPGPGRRLLRLPHRCRQQQRERREQEQAQRQQQRIVKANARAGHLALAQPAHRGKAQALFVAAPDEVDQHRQRQCRQRRQAGRGEQRDHARGAPSRRRSVAIGA
jgi:hypothetical protein